MYIILALDMTDDCEQDSELFTPFGSAQNCLCWPLHPLSLMYELPRILTASKRLTSLGVSDSNSAIGSTVKIGEHCT